MNNCSDFMKGIFNCKINSLYVRMFDGNIVFYNKLNKWF